MGCTSPPSGAQLSHTWQVQTNRHCSVMSDVHVDFFSHHMLELMKNNKPRRQT